MREAFDVPEDDRFILIHEHDDATMSYRASKLGIERSDELVIIQITCSDTRTLELKRAPYARIVELLVEHVGLRPVDVLINLVEVKKENWSFGRGEAQYA